jgi:hypothetical protein
MVEQLYNLVGSSGLGQRFHFACNECRAWGVCAKVRTNLTI